MKPRKRGKLQICFDVLQLLCEESKLNEKPSLTRVAHRANLPYDRFRGYLDHLIQLDMVSVDSRGKVAVTDKGLVFVEEYARMSDFLRHMGLLP